MRDLSARPATPTAGHYAGSELADRRSLYALSITKGASRATPGFFSTRTRIDFGIRAIIAEPRSGLVNYQNVPPLIAALVSSKIVTLHELQTVYGILDAHNLLEIVMVDRHNESILSEAHGNAH